jgi:hypothetical protein
MGNRIFIDIEGVDDSAILAIVERTIRQSFAQRGVPGSWRVQLRPSRVSGRWIPNVHGLDAQHTASMPVPPARLPELVPPRLRESLDRLCAPAIVEVGEDDETRPAHQPNPRFTG